MDLVLTSEAFIEFLIVSEVAFKLVPRNELHVVGAILISRAVPRLIHFIFFYFYEHFVECERAGLCSLNGFKVNEVCDPLVHSQLHNVVSSCKDPVLMFV